MNPCNLPGCWEHRLTSKLKPGSSRQTAGIIHEAGLLGVVRKVRLGFPQERQTRAEKEEKQKGKHRLFKNRWSLLLRPGNWLDHSEIIQWFSLEQLSWTMLGWMRGLIRADATNNFTFLFLYSSLYSIWNQFISLRSFSLKINCSVGYFCLPFFFDEQSALDLNQSVRAERGFIGGFWSVSFIYSSSNSEEDTRGSWKQKWFLLLFVLLPFPQRSWFCEVRSPDVFLQGEEDRCEDFICAKKKKLLLKKAFFIRNFICFYLHELTK